MRVFVVGASGAIVTVLVPQLNERGHEVVTRDSGIIQITEDTGGT